MPHRKLPNRDIGRLIALKTAFKKSETVTGDDMAIVPKTLNLLATLHPVYTKEMEERAAAKVDQVKATAEEQVLEDRLRMLISHFIQVFNLGVSRGTYQATERGHYQLDVSSNVVPPLTLETQVIHWGDVLVNGDKKRIADGGAQMTNPSIDEVEALLIRYRQIHSDQSEKKDAYQKEQKDVDNLREEAQNLVTRIWNEVELYFSDLSPREMRRRAREWGVVYAANPGEAAEPDLSAEEQEDLPGMEQ